MRGAQRTMLISLLLPEGIFLILFTALPFITMFEKSVYMTDYISTRYVGFKHYLDTFRDPDYRDVFVSSMVYAVTICVATTFVPLGVALFIYDLPKWMQNYVKFVFFVPSFTSGVIMTQVWRWIFQPRIGLLTYLTGLIGIKPVMWMAERWTAIFGISIMTISGIMGVPLLIYLSSILSINPELFDVARMDGATTLQVRTRIVLPLLVPSILLVILLTMMSGFFILETILLMTGGGYKTQTFIFNIFAEGINRSRIGLASARSVLMFFVILAMVLTKRRLEKRRA
jgi:multiple sugar transport system permease protein